MSIGKVKEQGCVGRSVFFFFLGGGRWERGVTEECMCALLLGYMVVLCNAAATQRGRLKAR